MYANGSVSQTNSEAQAWWQVDLESVQSIDSITLWNRTDCCGGRLNNSYVFISDTPFTSTDLTITRNQPGVFSYLINSVSTNVTIPVDLTGRYVRVQLSGTNVLSLAEVDVWSPVPLSQIPTPPPQPDVVSLRVRTNVTMVLAGVPIMDVTVEAINQHGQLATGYRGVVRFNSSSATTGLPRGGLGGATYTFTAADGGRRVWTGVTLNTPGTHTLNASDGAREGRSRLITVQTVTLSVLVSPTTVIASQPLLEVTVEARDQNGNLVPGYRGNVAFSSTSTFSGLPPGGLGGATYTFTAADGGRRTWTGVSLNQGGSHTISVRDGTRTATSAPVTVQAVTLTVQVGPTTVFAGEPIVEVTVEARDQNGNLVPGYRGEVAFSSTSTFSGLPPGGLGGATYTFTAADGGRRTWTGVTLHQGGSHTISVRDGTRTATSPPVTVQAVTLTVQVSPTTVFAGEPIVEVTVEARDQNGNLVPGYRGEVAFSSTSTFSGLPPGGLGGATYVFTAADGGRRTWTGVTLHQGGSHTISVRDGTRTATSNAITVNEVFFRTTLTSQTVYLKQFGTTLTIEVVDAQNRRVAGFRGGLYINRSVEVRNLPSSTLGSIPDTTMTAADAGYKAFPNLAFMGTGSHTITVIDSDNPDRRTTTDPMIVTLPPEPTPIGAGIPPAAYPRPDVLPVAPVIPYGWAQPFAAQIEIGINGWRGVPEGEVPASPGAYVITTVAAEENPDSPWWASYYPCVHVSWENPITSQRYEGGGVNPPHNDPSAIGSPFYGCGRGLHLPEDVAPLGTQGIHANVQGAGNTSGIVAVGVGGPDVNACPANYEQAHVGNPVDTRSGLDSYQNTDLGVATGCEEIGLHFTRTYRADRLGNGALGIGWSHSFEQRILVQGQDVVVQMFNGALLRFRDMGGDVYGAPAGSDVTLVKQPAGGWALLYRSGRIDQFNAQGLLTAQQDPNGNMLWMTYATYDQDTATIGRVQGTRLARVDAAGGRFLWFGYDYYQPNRIIVVGDHSGRVVRYGYDQETHNRWGRLTQVTDPLGHMATYRYRDPLNNGLGWLLTGKTDARGDVVFENTLDSRGRVIRQVNNQGQDLSFQYDIIADTDGLVAGTGLAPRLLRTVVTDQTGAQATYLYGFDGLLRRTIDPAGATTTYRGFTASRHPTEIVDGLGRITRITYNNQGLPLTITDALNQTSQRAYDSWGRTTAITDTLGRVTRLTYSGPHLTRLTDALGQTSVMTYTSQAGWQGMLTAATNPAGATTSFGYNAAGDLTTITDALNGVTTLAYDTLGRPTSMTDARGHTTTMTYDEVDRITGVTDALNGTVTVSYDPVGNMISLRDQLGATTVMTYTTGGRLTAVQDASGAVTSFGYDILGRLTRQTDPLGNQQTLSYDLAGRLSSQTDPLGNTNSYGYDVLGNTTVVTDANGHALRMTYDALNRLTEVRNAAGQFLQYGYDAMGNTTVLTNTLGHTAAIQYDARNRPTQYTDPEGRTTTRTYTSLDQLATVTDGVGRVTAYRYDALNRLIETLANYQPGQPAGADVNVRTGYAYDAVGNLTALTDPRGFVTSFSYDARNRKSSMTDPLNRVTRYAYDARSLLTRWEQPDGTVVSYSYDALGRRTSVTAPDASSTTRYDAAGRTIELTDGTGTTRFQYDAASRPLTVTLSLGGAVSYRYDGVGNRTQVVYPDGKTVQYSYSPANQLQQVTDWSGGVTTMQHDGAGRLTSVTRPNGTSTTVSYDRAGLPMQINHGGMDVFSYTYDGSGRRSGAVEGTRVLTYTYDGLARLTAATASSGPSSAYSYDAAGNRLSANEGGTASTATFDAANQLVTLNGVAVQYDGRGNLRNDGVQQYRYDGLNRLRSTTRAGVTTSYQYNGWGDKVQQTVAGQTSTFTLDLAAALTEVLAVAQGGSSTHMLPGLGEVTNGSWRYYHTDPLGSVRLLSDGAGQITECVSYTPFGVPETPANLPFASFTGEAAEASSGLLYLRARHYHPALGRFRTPDALIPDVANGQAWNRYAYV